MNVTSATTEAAEFVVHDNGHREEKSPLLVVEIETPDTRFTPMMRRIASHFRDGADIVWLLHPDEKMVTVFRPHHHLEVLAANDELTGGELLPSFSCKVADLFRLPGQPVTPTTPA